MKYSLFGKFTSVDNKRNELAQILLEAANELHKNHDCIHYVISTCNEDLNGVWVWELWTSKEAHDKSLEPQEIKDLIAKARPFIAGMSERQELDVVGGKGV